MMIMVLFLLISLLSILSSLCMFLKCRFVVGLLSMQMLCLLLWCWSLVVSLMCCVLLLESVVVDCLRWMQLSLMLMSVFMQWWMVWIGLKNFVVFLIGILSILVMFLFLQCIVSVLWLQCLLWQILQLMYMLGRKFILILIVLLLEYVLQCLFLMLKLNCLGWQLWIFVLGVLLNREWMWLNILVQVVGFECGVWLIGV